MTYQGAAGQNGNQLAEKLRREYRNRGIAASSANERMKYAQMGRASDRNTFRQPSAGTANRAEYADRRGNREQQTYFAEKEFAKTNVKRNRYKNGADHAKMQNQNVFSQKEIVVEKKRFPMVFLLLLSFVTVMIMMIILSIAQIYETTDEISVLKYRINALQTTAAELELKIEEKNDIRIIEQIATNQLGMVKEDSVQKKYISLSDGERIEIVNDTTNENIENEFVSMLSSIWTAFGDFFAGLQ